MQPTLRNEPTAGAPEQSAPDATRAERSIVKDSLRVLLGGVGSQVVGLVRGLAIPVLVSPAQYGLWRILLLVWQYGMYTHLGAFEYLSRELPGLLATERREDAEQLQRTALWGTLIATAAIAALLLATSLVLPMSTDAAWAFRISAIGLVALQLQSYQACVLRATSQFGRMSAASFLSAIGGLVFMLLLAPLLGVAGLALGMLLSYVIVTAVFVRWVPFSRPDLPPRGFGKLALHGSVLTSFPFMNTAMASVGAVVCAAMLDLAETGYFGVGLMLGTVVFAIPRALTTVLYPRYLREVAITNDPLSVGALMRQWLLLTSTIAPIVVAGCAVGVEALFRLWLVDYLPGVPSAWALLGMMAFMSLPVIIQDAVLAMRRHWPLLALQAGFLIITAGLAVAGAVVERNAFGIAMGVALGNTAFSITVLVFALHWASTTERAVWREVLGYLGPTFLMGAVAYIVMLLVPLAADTIGLVARTTVRGLLVAAVGGVLLWIRLPRSGTTQATARGA